MLFANRLRAYVPKCCVCNYARSGPCIWRAVLCVCAWHTLYSVCILVYVRGHVCWQSVPISARVSNKHTQEYRFTQNLYRRRRK